MTDQRPPLRPGDEGDIPTGVFLEITVEDEAYLVRWYWTVADVPRGFNAEGRGPTLDDAVRAAADDLED
ncbi:hypothetical protein [Actinomadura macra]|uniref:hypothetical protein n=1 Tax=Actinomadura macra TaxID=46164 RepID=UPI0008345222|nr:hypothetical protein [Actinomadura macra]